MQHGSVKFRVIQMASRLPNQYTAWDTLAFSTDAHKRPYPVLGQI